MWMWTNNHCTSQMDLFWHNWFETRTVTKYNFKYIFSFPLPKCNLIYLTHMLICNIKYNIEINYVTYLWSDVIIRKLLASTVWYFLGNILHA